MDRVLRFLIVLLFLFAGSACMGTQRQESATRAPLPLSQGSVPAIQNGGPGPGTICGATDDRVLSSDSRVGRLSFVAGTDGAGDPIVNSACTAWLISNGTVLTAGHCVDFDPDGAGSGLPDGLLDLDDDDLVEFQPPPSQSDGTLQPAPAERRYSIDLDSVVWAYEGEGESLGNDWAVLRLLPNDITEKFAGNIQGGFRVTNVFPNIGTSVRVTGYGTDMTPDGTRNQVLQTHNGPLFTNGLFGSTLEYGVDTTGGNSGSPIIWEFNQVALGIHTNGGCDAGGGANTGTGFNHLGLRAAIDVVVNGAQDYESSGTLHVDHSALFPAQQSGSLFRPFSTLGIAHAAASEGQKISLMAGSYGSESVVLDKRVLIVAPVGPATIGP